MDEEEMLHLFPHLAETGRGPQLDPLEPQV